MPERVVNLKTELSNKAVVIGESDELTLDQLRAAVVALGEKGVEGYAKVVVTCPTRNASNWSVVATWDPEGAEF